VPVSATDGVKNSDETDVDCGGSVAPRCADGKTCGAGTDCTSKVCTDGTCQAPTHTDGQQNGAETAVDCGGAGAPKCANGLGCAAATDCESSVCAEDKMCAVPTATDKVKNGTETDVDCGGADAPKCKLAAACVAGSDCVEGVCGADNKCAAPTKTDGVKNGTETDVDCGGGAPTSAPKCAVGLSCVAAGDCTEGVCGADSKCAAPTKTDGVKNGTESDVDCGGGAPSNAPKCFKDKDCSTDTDCFWGTCGANKKCGGDKPGVKDGDQTDIDCGGKLSPACDWFKSCLVDDDCTSKMCDPTKKCTPAKSCKAKVFGGTTCGAGESSELGKNHETCCKSLPVTGYADASYAGKTVYLDKYEITAGRMRAFLESLGGGVDATGNALPANVKGWAAANRPARWQPKWEEVLPDNNVGVVFNYTTANPTPADNLMYPGQDQYAANAPTQGSWNVRSGTWGINTGVFANLSGGGNNFPEMNTEYAATHAFNCYNGSGSYGWATYWIDAATNAAYNGGAMPKANGKDGMDEKSLNCAPNALFAAFCAWDGGVLATAEVMDFITGNTAQPAFLGGTPNGRYTTPSAGLSPGGGNSQCQGYDPNNFENDVTHITTYGDGANRCGYYYGATNAGDDSARIAAPGRTIVDTMRLSAGDEPWMDMIGNLVEIVTKKGETNRFDYRGYGHQWGSITHHRNQITTSRYRSGAMGARCMRFK
jgi:hypothetical protein